MGATVRGVLSIERQGTRERNYTWEPVTDSGGSRPLVKAWHGCLGNSKMPHFAASAHGRSRRFSRVESTTDGNDLRNCSMVFISEDWAET